MIPFTVHKEKIEDAKKTISELISKVRENEPKTLLYKSLQMKKDPASFIHFMIFADNAAHMKHRSAPYVLDFVKKLYDLCPNEPYPIFLDSFDSCGALIQELEK